MPYWSYINEKRGIRTDPPPLQGYHHSPPPSSPLISSAFALWANAELYILGPSLPFFLPFSPPPPIIFSSAFALWANLELYILGPSLTYFLSFSLSFLSPFFSPKESWKKHFNIDARTLKFCMGHPWTQSLRFRENQIVCMSLSLLVGLLPYWN